MVRCLCGRNHEEETCIEDRRLEDQKRCYSNAMFKSDNELRGALGHRRNHEEEEACKDRKGLFSNVFQKEHFELRGTYWSADAWCICRRNHKEEEACKEDWKI